MERLRGHVPEQAYGYVSNLLGSYDVLFKISRPRKTKLGDYRYFPNKQIHQITVNEDLNEYSFLITLIHEIAHYLQFRNNKRRRLAPHGLEWKLEYKALMEPLLEEGLFPSDIQTYLEHHMENPKASSCSDVKLMRILSNYDSHSTTRLEDIPNGALFSINNGRIFQKGIKQRTRFKCLEPATKKTWFVHSLTEVEIVE